MKKAEQIINEFIYKFVEDYWDKINLKRAGITKSKGEFLTEVAEDFDAVMWVLTEIAAWSMDKVYLSEIYVEFTDSEDVDFSVIKIGTTYIKLEYIIKTRNYKVEIVEPKFKQVMYF